MKNLDALPVWAKVLVFFLAMSVTTQIAGMVPILNDFVSFFVVALVLSWALSSERNKLFQSLGFLPVRKTDYWCFGKGLLIGILMLIVTAFITFQLSGDEWKLKTHIDPIFIAVTFLICLWSAFVQEFVFRGYPFQALLNKYGPWVAQVVILIPFGLMHINHQMSFTDMVTVMLTTGLGSVLFGLAYIKSRRMYLPIGIHLGWNFAQALIPRTVGAGQTGLIAIKNHAHGYGDFVIIGPYFLVVLVSISLLYLTKQRFNVHSNP